MHYSVFDTAYHQQFSANSRAEALDMADYLNFQEGHYRFVPLVDSYRQNPYRRNPDHIPISIKTPAPVWPNWKDRIISILEEFNPTIDWSKIKVRRSGRTIEFVTPRSSPHSYRISIKKDPGFMPELKHGKTQTYFSYDITEAYLSDENIDAIRAVFRLLFMGDEFLLPFLAKGTKRLSPPQQRAFDGFMQSYHRNDDKGAIILPTGIGKTVVAAKIITTLKPKSLLFVSHRNFILSQAIDTIKNEAATIGWDLPHKDFGEFYGDYKITSAKRGQLLQKYVFANPQSFNALAREKTNKAWGDKKRFDLIIVDEFHHGNAKTWFNIIDYFKPRYLLGLTATPYRSDAEKPLSLVDDNMLYIPSQWEREHGERTLTLINALKLGYLVTPTIKPMLHSKQRTIIGEFVAPAVKEKVKQQDRIERAKKIIERYQYDAQGKQAVVFCANAEEVVYLEKAFKKEGIVSDHLLGTKEHTKCCTNTQNNKKRDTKLANFRTGKTKVLFVMDVLNEGVDITNIEVILWLRETRSIVKLLQQLGRGLRLAEGKRKLLVLDFMDNIRKVQQYIREGFKEQEQKQRKKKDAKRKIKTFKETKEEQKMDEELEFIELLESRGMIQAGPDISLFAMSGSIEASEDELSVYQPKVDLAPPKPTKSAIQAMKRTAKHIGKIKDQIIKMYTKEADYQPSALIIANKLDYDHTLIHDILYEAGLVRKGFPLHPSNIEKTYSLAGQKKIIDEAFSKTEQNALRRILKVGSKVLGDRSMTHQDLTDRMGKHDRCRIPECKLIGKHRGLCEAHYLFAFSEIRAGNAFEDDLIIRFLMEPQTDSDTIRLQKKPKPRRRQLRRKYRKRLS